MPRATRVPAALALAVTVVLLAACEQGAGPRQASPGASRGPATTPGATSARQGGAAEPNVISGRVTNEVGDPIAGTRVRIVGYTGGASLGREIETVMSGADGGYRYTVPRGLYEVLGQATIEFDGQSYVFDLEPADGRCDQQMSDDGIVKDLVLRLTGLKPCRRDALPDNYLSYNGAAIQLFGRMTGNHSPDAVVEYTLEPIGPLADGSSGRTLTMKRTIPDLSTSAGPIDSTWILYDIPLAKYRVTAALLEQDGRRVELFVSTLTVPAPTTSVDISFDARKVLGGYTVPQVSTYDEPELG